jgi:hypothetical protein
MKKQSTNKPPIKKQFIQSMLEKMTEEELLEFHKFLASSTGNAAKVWVLRDSAERTLKARLAPRTSPKISPEESEKKLFAALVSDSVKKRAVEIQKVAKAKNAALKIDSPAFMSCIKALFGENDFFGDEAMKAAQSGDAAFFELAAEAIKATLPSNKNTEENRKVAHLTIALIILTRDVLKKGQRKITKQKMEECILREIGKTNIKPYSDADSWQDLWRRPELSPFLKQAHNGRSPKTSGKGRAVTEY